MQLQVKYGLIRILNTQVDLCDYSSEVDLDCPLKKGELEFTKVVELPKEIPPVGFLNRCFGVYPHVRNDGANDVGLVGEIHRSCTCGHSR